jgi:hypothetical protein
MGVKYFFDVPVYRLPEDRYYRERGAYIEGVLFLKDSPYADDLRARDKADPSQNAAIRGHLERPYGGCWRFNEIIGYICLHFLGSQVRGEYYTVRKKRIVRTRTKTLEYTTWKLAPEVDIPQPPSGAAILSAIREYLRDCEKELPGRYIDTSMFDVIANHVDWHSLYRAP